MLNITAVVDWRNVFDPVWLGEEVDHGILVTRILNQLPIEVEEQFSLLDNLTVIIVTDETFTTHVDGTDPNVNQQFEAVIGDNSEGVPGPKGEADLAIKWCVDVVARRLNSKALPREGLAVLINDILHWYQFTINWCVNRRDLGSSGIGSPCVINSRRSSTVLTSSQLILQFFDNFSVLLFTQSNLR